MNQTLLPGPRSGAVDIPASKSQAHRLLICAALGQTPVALRCRGISRDIAATISCLNALGAGIHAEGEVLTVQPITNTPNGVCHLFCGESGSTLRFLLPVVGLLGAEAVFHMEGRLPQRPLHPLDEVLTAHGMTVRQEGALLFCGGKLRPGAFSLPGDVSSQYISGLLMALPLLDEASSLTVTGQMESAAYIAMTESVLNRGGIALRRSGSVWHIPGGQRCRFPADIRAEGDWSNAAFFLCMGALSPAGISVRGLDLASPQGDRAVLDILTAMGAEVSVSEEAVTVRRGALRGVAIDAGPIPDLIPVLCDCRRSGGRYADFQRRTPAAQGIRPSPHHGGAADRLGRSCGGAVQRPPRPRHRPSHRRHGGRLRRPPHRHVRRYRGLPVYRAGDGLRQRMRCQILPRFLERFFRPERRRPMSQYGEHLHLTIFGQSHAPAIGMTLEGLPAGEAIDMEALQGFLNRRAPGQNEWSTPRKEADVPEFLSGLVGNVTCGTPLTAIIRNTNTRSGDYAGLSVVPRPGHADFTAAVKYGGHADFAGGGAFSGRLTAPLCIAGGICLQLLRRRGITVISRIAAIGGVTDTAPLTASTAEKPFPVVEDAAGEAIRAAIAAAKAEGDSVGGIIECAVLGLPVGLGGPLFDGMEGKIASIIFGIPAVKGIEFGAGFAAAALRGSENNDAFTVENGTVKTVTNHCGGILGGITNGMPLTFRTAFKPTPSIAKEQQSVNLTSLTPETLRVQGRHDPCIVPRAVPCVEAAAAVAVYDALLGEH